MPATDNCLPEASMSAAASDSAKKAFRVGVLICSSSSFSMYCLWTYGILTQEYHKAYTLLDAIVSKGKERSFLCLNERGSESRVVYTVDRVRGTTFDCEHFSTSKLLLDADQMESG